MPTLHTSIKSHTSHIHHCWRGLHPLSLNCMKGRSACSIISVCVCYVVSNVSLPFNLLFCESELFITPRKDVIQHPIFPIPVQELQNFPSETGSGETLSHPVAYLFIIMTIALFILCAISAGMGGVTHPMRRGRSSKERASIYNGYDPERTGKGTVHTALLL